MNDTTTRDMLSPEAISAMTRKELLAELVRFTECAEQARGTMPPFKMNPQFEEGSDLLDTAATLLDALEEHRQPGGMTLEQLRAMVCAFVLIDMAQHRMQGQALS